MRDGRGRGRIILSGEMADVFFRLANRTLEATRLVTTW